MLVNKFSNLSLYLCDNAPMTDWEDLRFFASLARAGSLSAAARELRVDHATVGRRVAALERALSVRLVDRLPRHSPLTAEGAALAALARDMERIVHTIERRAKAVAISPATIVRIAAPPAVAARLIAPHVVEFHRANPDVTLVLLGASQNASLDRGEADIALRLSRPTEKSLLIRRIGVMRFALYGRPEIAAKPPERWSFIAYDAALDHVPQQIWLRSILDGRQVVFQASDLFGQVEAARAGLGVAVLPHFMGDGDAALVCLPTDRKPPTRDLWIAAYPDLARAPAVRTVMNFLTETIGKACPTRISR
jgi:DNA-binding transcriptional LysR family regulator